MVNNAGQRVIVFYEHVDREKPVVKGLLEEFGKREIPVKAYSYLYEYFKCLNDCKDFVPTHVILPYVYTKNSLSRYRHLFQKFPNLRVVNMHHEQIVAPFNLEKAIPSSSVALDGLVHVSWGANYTEMLMNAGVVRENIIEICSPRIPPPISPSLKLELRDRFAREFNLDPKKQWVLFCEDRDWVLGDKAKMFRALLRFGVSDKELERFFSYRKKCLMNFLEQLKNLSDSFFQHHELIYRSHPGVAGMPQLPSRVKSISSHTVYEWLQCVDYNIVDGSTTCFEADAMGVRTAVYQTCDRQKEFDVFGLEKYITVKSLEDLSNPNLNERLQRQIGKKIYEDYLGDCERDFFSIFAEQFTSDHGLAMRTQEFFPKRVYFLRKFIFEKLYFLMPAMVLDGVTAFLGYGWLKKDRPIDV